MLPAIEEPTNCRRQPAATARQTSPRGRAGARRSNPRRARPTAAARPAASRRKRTPPANARPRRAANESTRRAPAARVTATVVRLCKAPRRTRQERRWRAPPLRYRADAAPLAIAEVRRYLRLADATRARRGAERSSRCCGAPTKRGSDAHAGGRRSRRTDLAHLAQDLPEQADLLESEDDAPIIRLINALLTQAVKENASDIHIEPFENRLVVRFRVDGVLREVLQSKRAVAPLVVSRIKVMSKLDIAEKRLPQDGRISLAHRRPRGRRARLDDPVRSRRARGAASARQAGRPARPQRARHGCRGREALSTS